MPRLKLKSSRTFLAIKRCEGTKVGKVIKQSRCSKLRWAHICAHSCIPVNTSCPRVLVSQHKQQSTIIWLGITRPGTVERCSSKQATSSAFLPCAPSPSLLTSSLISIRDLFLHPTNSHEKRTTKTSRKGTKMSWDGLTLGKINFWIYSKSIFTSPATCFECYDGTGTEMGRRRLQRWVGYAI